MLLGCSCSAKSLLQCGQATLQTAVRHFQGGTEVLSGYYVDAKRAPLRYYQAAAKVFPELMLRYSCEGTTGAAHTKFLSGYVQAAFGVVMWQ